ncbi:MAG: TRAP transporter small permease subunit [Ectothiorhodospiraceae bacterium]|jgi:TRAP-type mannitol/chloroaromatic compound transport system permease small subunit
MLKSLADALDRILAAMDRVSLWLARLGGLLILATVAMVTLEIITRGIWGWSLGASTEISGYVLAISASWSFAFTLLRKAHIRIDVVYVRLPATIRSLLDLLALSGLGLFCFFVVGSAIKVASSSYAGGSLANTPLQTPLWIPQWMWAAGLIWFSLAVTVLLLRVLVALFMADTESAHRVAGSATLDEQISAEIQGDEA